MLGSKNYIGSAIAALTIATLLQWSGLAGGFQNVLSDTRAQLASRQATGQIVFIGIDKKSLDQIGQWPWPRSVYAEAIERLVAQDVADIALDIDLSNRSNVAEDSVLAASLEAAGGSVVLPTYLQIDSANKSLAILEQSKPIALFSDLAWVASVNVVPEHDGFVRRYPQAILIEGELVPSLSSMMSQRSEFDTSEYLIDFSIDPSSVPTYSFARLISGELPEGILKDKTVLIGAFALELRDNFAVPLHGALPGPLLHVLAAETLLQSRILRPTSSLASFILALLVAVAALFCFPKMKLRTQLLALGVFAVSMETVGFYLQSQFDIVLTSAPVLIFLILIALIRLAAELDLKGWLLRIARVETKNTKQVLDQVFADSSDAILILAEDGTPLRQNDRFAAMFGTHRVRSLADQSFADLPNQVLDDARSAIGRLKDGLGGDSIFGQLTIPKKDQSVIIDYSITPSRITRLTEKRSVREEPLLVATITMRDVTIETRQKQQLVHLSKYDSLTDAEQRSEFARRLFQGGTAGNPTTIFAIGILRFTTINDTLGREIGDELLQELVKRLARLDNRIDGIARLDGDSFAVRLVKGLDTIAIGQFPGKILRDLARPFQLEAQQISVDFCLGIATGEPDNAETANRLINHAEFALKDAARHGPNGIFAFDPELNSKQQRARLIEREMQPALNAGQFHIVFQPQVMAADGSPIGAEALLRWTHPELGIISPGEFIAIAEANGLITRLGQIALNQACRDATAWPAHITVSVNVSAIQFMRSNIVQDVKNALKSSGLPAHRLELEITESCFIAATDSLFTQLTDLKSLGISLALDDFGTGFSSLGYFSRFPFDKIKVDQSFVRHIATNATSQSIVQSIKVLADGLGVKVLCEGVETEDELRIIRLLGCDEIQGYLYGKPQPANEFIRFMATDRAAVGS